jgi:hypothetical protein
MTWGNIRGPAAVPGGGCPGWQVAQGPAWPAVAFVRSSSGTGSPGVLPAAGVVAWGPVVFL